MRLSSIDFPPLLVCRGIEGMKDSRKQKDLVFLPPFPFRSIPLSRLLRRRHREGKKISFSKERSAWMIYKNVIKCKKKKKEGKKERKKRERKDYVSILFFFFFFRIVKTIVIKDREIEERKRVFEEEDERSCSSFPLLLWGTFLNNAYVCDPRTR